MSDQEDIPHVVIVEDEEILLKFLVYHVEQAGYRATPVTTGGAMFEIVNREKVDLILLDLGLPDGDGLSWAQQLRSQTDLPIIILTGRTGDDDRIMALGLGADDYLTKPCDPRELLLRMRNLLGRAGAQAGPAAAPASVPPPGPASPPPEQRKAPPDTSGERRAERRGDRRAAGGDRRSAGEPRRPSMAVIVVGGILLMLTGGGVTWFLVGGDEPPPSPPVAAAPAQTPPATPTPQAAPQPTPLPPATDAPASDTNLTKSVTASPPTQLAEERADDPTGSTGAESESAALADRPVASTSYAWVLRSKCDPLPNVAWWRVKEHTDIVRYVNRRHFGDWLPYIKSWTKRLAKLKDIRSRDSGIRTRTGEVLKGASLDTYIGQTEKRIQIVKCLSLEAADYARSRAGIRR